MSAQQNVLLVTNAATDAEIAQIRQTLKNYSKIKLSLAHIIPTLPTSYFNIPSMVLLAERYYEEARQSLAYVGEQLEIGKRDQWLISGRPRTEVLRLASQLRSRFILASHPTITELHKPILFSKQRKNTTPIKHINQVSASDINQ